MDSKLNYPKVKRDGNFVEKLHGINVPDPYRWLEDNDDKEVKKFCEEQQNLTQSYIEQAPNRDDMRNKLTDMFNYTKYECPKKCGDNYFIEKNDGLQNQNVWYKFKNLNGEHELFLDPNTFSSDGTSTISLSSFSKDGKWLAYAVSTGGSDWQTIKVRNVDTKIDLPDLVQNSKSINLSWTHDNLGFFYAKYDRTGDVLKDTDPDENQKLYYHRINTPQSQDVLVYDMPDHPNYYIENATVSECGKILNISTAEDCRYIKWYYARLDENTPINGRFKIYPIIDKFEGEYYYLTNDDNLVYFRTNKNAPNYRVCRLDLSSENPGDPENWVDIVAEDEKAVLENVICVHGDKLAVIFMRDVVNTLEIRQLKDGKLFKKFDIPIGTIASLSGERKHNEIFLYFTSFLSPGTIYYYDFNSTANDLEVYIEIKPKGFDANEFVTKQVFFESKDGQVKVPMFLVHHKELKLNSQNPTLLYGYGGFCISLKPEFDLTKLLFVKHFKGVYAVANIRGGGEYGSKWYEAGRQLNKQKSYDDFQQAGEYLIENGYTSKEKLIIEGISNGGLLVAVCANQRPDLFGAVIIDVGVLDLLRFDKFTVGKLWTCDFGFTENEQHFKNQLKLSPLHNAPKNCSKYPATILLTADHDNRVVPLHSFKHTAELQYTVARKVSDPILLRVEMNAGHGEGKSITKILETTVDVYSFLQVALGLKYYDYSTVHENLPKRQSKVCKFSCTVL